MGMMVYGGGRLEDVASRMAEVIAGNPSPDPLLRTQVVVHSNGMARWLRQELAKSSNLGVCANMDMLFPGNFFKRWIFNPMERLLSGAPDAGAGFVEDPVLNVHTMTWLVFKVLSGGLESGDSFRPIARYLGDGDDMEIRRYQLSCRIARAFDRYSSYRPEMLRRWQGSSVPSAGASTGGERWQAELWRAMIESSPALRTSSDLFWDFVQGRAPPETLSELKMHPAVYFFGISALPPAQLALLQKLSESVPVHFFWMNPSEGLYDRGRGRKEMERQIERIRACEVFSSCERLAAEMEAMVRDESGNPLLGSLGRIPRDLHRLLLGCDMAVHEHVVARIAPAESPGGILGTIQEDILMNVLPEEAGRIELNPGDRSITISNCHNPLREAETLRDFLLRCFDQDPGLLPKDIIVFVPDLEEYAPAIESVFGSGNPYSRMALPFTIADRTLQREYPSASAFLSALEVLGGRFKAGEVMSLLGYGGIRSRAGIDDDDWDVLQRLLRESRVAWGIDGDFRRMATGCGFGQNSWRFAVERLVLGAAMMKPGDEVPDPCFAPSADGVGDGAQLIAPLEMAENHSALVGSLCEWLERLFALRREIDGAGSRSCFEWLDMLERAAAELLPSPASDEGAMEILRAVAAIRGRMEGAGLLESRLSWDLLLFALKESIEGESSDEKFCCGHATFCRFQPMRGIPARIVCMLGMNDGALPRQQKQLGFDLMDPSSRWTCDRWSKDDDRYAFLEALMSARGRLYISYTGRSDTDRQEMPPSILVSELLSYIASRTSDPSSADSLVMRHPMHPFSPKCFSTVGSALPPSCSRLWRSVAQNLYGPAGKPRATMPRRSPPPEDPAALPGLLEIRLSELTEFFLSPCRHYAERTLGIDLHIGGSDCPDDVEPTDLDKLSRFNLRSLIWKAVDSVQDGSPAEMQADAGFKGRFISRLRAEGVLPVGMAGERIFDEIWGETFEWIGRLRKMEGEAGEKLDPLQVDIRMEIPEFSGKLRISHEIGGLRREARLVARPSSCKPKDLLRMAVEQAAMDMLAADGGVEIPRRSVFLGMDGEREQERMENPRGYLERLLGIYIEGRRRPLCFWLDAACAGMKRGIFDPEKARGAWEPSYMEDAPGRQSKPDAYTRSFFGDRLQAEDLLREFEEITKAIVVFKV